MAAQLRLLSVTDPVGNVTSFGYDALGRKISTSNLAIQANPLTRQTYEPDGPLATLVIARGNTVADTTSYAYDGFDRLSTTTYPDSSTEVLTYDADANVLTGKTRAGATLAFAYDTLNRRCTKTISTTATACGGTSASPLVLYAYDQDGRLTGANDNSAAITTPSASASYAMSASYDALNHPIAINWSPAPAQTTPAGPSSVTFTHGYDADNRRISQAANDNSWLGYPAATAATTGYTANDLNQYTAVGGVTPTYDGDGSLTCDGGFKYAYDAESRLTGISSLATYGACSSATTAVASYAYDAQGRRKSKTVGGATTIYVTDADNREVLEYDGSTGALQTWYAFGPGPDGVLNAMNVAGGTRQTLIPDIQGSIIGELASSGTLTKTPYQPFGENPALASNGYFYTGRRLDPETAGSAAQPSGIYYYRARMYSPTWGRFLQADSAGYGAGANLYAYVNNDPLNLVDPTGLTQDSPQVQTGGVNGSADGDVVYGLGPRPEVNPESITLASNYAQKWAVAGAAIGAPVGAVVVAGGCDAATGGACVAATPGTVAAGAVGGATVGAATGYALGNAADQFGNAVNANSSSSMSGTEVYNLINNDTGAIDKIGITSYPDSRYSQAYLDSENVTYVPVAEYQWRYAAMVDENIRLTWYQIDNNGNLPRLNKVTR